MCRIILPIKEIYSRDLLSGRKNFELRRTAPKRKVDEILIYETAPTSKIVGTLKIKKTHKLKISDLWILTKDSNSLTRKEFNDYFSGKEYGFAFEVDKRSEYKKYQKISKYNLKAAPQGFVYAD